MNKEERLQRVTKLKEEWRQLQQEAYTFARKSNASTSENSKLNSLASRARAIRIEINSLTTPDEWYLR